MSFIKNKTKENVNFGIQPPRYSSNEEIMYLQRLIEELGNIINNQSDTLRKISSKLGETLFRLNKVEEQSQLYRIGIRVQRDRLNMFHKTICELGLIDKEIFDVVFSNIEEKNLPITMSGRVNANISLTRYNTSDKMETPRNAVQS